MEDAFTLLNKLLTRPNDEIDGAVLTLMIKGKLDSHRVFDAYMKAIEHDKQDLEDRLIGGLYNLNTSRQFNIKSLNEKYGYNEDEDKKLSWYWRENKEK